MPAYLKKETPQGWFPAQDCKSQQQLVIADRAHLFHIFAYHLQFYATILRKNHFFLLEIMTFSQWYTDIPHPLQIQKDNKDLAVWGVAIIEHYFVNDTEESDDLCSCHPLSVWKQAG